MADETSLSSRPLPDLIGGRYRIVSRLGVGGMGVVYKATDAQLKRSVAVKALEERRLHIPGAAARLRTEALAAASLDHPYICKVYELVETSHDTFIVMEYIEGETLASMLKRGALPLLQTLQLGREIAEGLANAHARGLVHRDVKPSNVMVTTHGHVKLLDFGVAGADVESASRNVTSTLSPQLTVHAGTPQYMAPEQAAGNPITTRADLFSLGVVLYECLTGQLPFSGTTTFDYVRHVMQSPPRRLDRVAPDTPADLVDLVDQLLEKTPADRPESAEAVVTKLRQLEDGLTAPTGGIRTARQARAGRRWKVVASLALLTALVAVGWRFVLPQTPDDTPRQLRPFVTTSAVEFNSQISPDGEWLSFIATTAGASRIMTQRIDGGEARPLTLAAGEPVSQIWAPDGRQIAVVLELDGKQILQVFPAFFGGEPTLTADLGVDKVDLVRWIDRHLYLKARNSAGVFLRRLSLDSPAVASDLSSPWKIDGTLRSVDVTPDGRMAVIAVSRNGQEDLRTIDIDGSGLHPLTDDAFFERDPRWIGRGDRIVFRSNRGGQLDLWQMDVRTKALTQLTSSAAEEIAESTSVDGRIISYRQLTKSANLWQLGGPGQQLTQDSLSDYSPVLSGDGRTLAFQRSQPTPSLGYTILDAKVFVSPFEAGPVIDARSIADAFAPDLSSDGQWLAYLQRSDRPDRMALSVRDLRGGSTVAVSRSTSLPSLRVDPPVDWSARVTGWSAAGNDLFFIDWADVMVVRRYRAGEPSAGPPIVRSTTDKAYLRDLYVSPGTGRLAYIASTSGVPLITVHEVDPATDTMREIASFKDKERGLGIVGRGWLDRQFVLFRTIQMHDDRTADLEILVTTDNGGVRVAGRVTHVFTATTRLHVSERALYMTRSEKGTHNVYALSLTTERLTQVTQNALPGVTYSGFQPVGSRGVIGAREERREDIWLIQQTATPRSGKSAGR